MNYFENCLINTTTKAVVPILRFFDPPYEWLVCKFPNLRKIEVKFWYDAVAKNFRPTDGAFKLMNYGYAYEYPDGFPLLLYDCDKEEFIFSWQLIYETVKEGNLSGKEVLVVGCGRGGDAYFIKRYLHAKSVVGIDLSERAIDICQKNKSYHIEGLSFQSGDAENLPFKSQQFDAVVNIESSHCYPNPSRFYKEVYRVLKQGGAFLYADLFKDRQNKVLQNLLLGAGFGILNEVDITQNIIWAAEQGYDRRKEFVQKSVPECLIHDALEWSGTKDTRDYRAFKEGLWSYKRFVLGRGAPSAACLPVGRDSLAGCP